jgi:hypothetical protein
MGKLFCPHVWLIKDLLSVKMCYWCGKLKELGYDFES